eukprot:TRINITY_DN111562_c0_g1_i1.p1 TRINITY_DN111562_c0_g1~~TRINITY_DN111562_c0_g1_i1.p1  ORF type:complete len:252 (-),score=29.68 TRINITY_DN111562_c0_g1_i1:457-1122(-)
MAKFACLFSLFQVASSTGRALIVIDMSVEQWRPITYKRDSTYRVINWLMKEGSTHFDYIIDSHLWMNCDKPAQSTLCDETPVGRAGTAKAELLPQLRHPWVKFVEKQQFSCFYGSTLDATLRNAGVDSIYLVGINTDYCVFATTLEAWERGYNVTVFTDGVTSVGGEGGHAMGLKMHSQFFGKSPNFRLQTSREFLSWSEESSNSGARTLSSVDSENVLLS